MKNKQHPQKEVLICTARYSDNLGDGVISECVEFLIKKAAPQTSVSHLDIAGRSQYFEKNTDKISATKKIFYSAPKFIRPALTILAWHLFMKRRIKSAINQNMPTSNFSLVFGGGQLISDIALNFPLKFNYICQTANSRNASISASALGVSRKTSWLGKLLFRKAFSSESWTYISARDNASKKNLGTLVDQDVFETVDPAIWARDCYGVKVRKKDASAPIRIGLGIAHPLELSAHIKSSDRIDVESTKTFWIELALRIIEAGHTPIFFTNGSTEDKFFCTSIIKAVKLINYSQKFEVAPTPQKPEDLVSIISNTSTIVSHRLHANIIANALSIPSVYLLWDQKVNDFAKKINRSQWCAKTTDSPISIYDLIMKAYALGIDEVHLSKMKSEAFDEIKKLVRASQP